MRNPCVKASLAEKPEKGKYYENNSMQYRSSPRRLYDIAGGYCQENEHKEKIQIANSDPE